MKIYAINNANYHNNHYHRQTKTAQNVTFEGKKGAMTGGIMAAGLVVSFLTGGLGAPLAALFAAAGAGAATATIGGAAVTIGTGAIVGSQVEDNAKKNDD